MNSAKEVQQERERQRQFQEEQQLTQQAFNKQGELSRDFIERSLDTGDVRVGDSSDLQEVTVAKLQSMLSKQWILSNLTDAQEHDIRFKLEVMKLKIHGSHPPDESCITGPTRAYLYDDPMENLQPLTQQERLLIDEVIETVKAMVTRGRGGFERKQMNTSIAQTESHQKKEGENGSKLGLFG